jgi:predicted 3-demethylubiquinone-9 3-methyltransferase (glyoxalase superfamily)
MDNRDGNYEIYFARISSDGATKLGSDLRLTSDASASESPSLAWTGSEFGVSWADDRDGNYEIYFARVSSFGAKLGSDLRVTSNGSFSYFPSLAWTGSEFGVSWHDSRDGNYEIYFARIAGVCP